MDEKQRGVTFAPAPTPSIAVLTSFPPSTDDTQDVKAASSPDRKVPTPVIILGWISLSTTVIFFNRKIMVDSGFPFPVALTTLHLLFQTLATRLLNRHTSLVFANKVSLRFDKDSSLTARDQTPYDPLPINDQADMSLDQQATTAMSADMSWTTWRRKILPVAVLTSASLVLSNSAYLFISTSFIHILKSFGPCAILLAAFVAGTKSPNTRLVTCILVITAGTAAASYGEIRFNWTGFLIQAVAIAIEATRVTLIQLLLQGQGNMTPLQSLYHFAPACLAINAAIILPLEGTAPFFAIWDGTTSAGPLTLLLNSSLSFALNLSATYLIGVSAIVLSLSKVIKDVSIVALSALVVGESLTALQIFGYGVATAGLVAYKVLNL